MNLFSLWTISRACKSDFFKSLRFLIYVFLWNMRKILLDHFINVIISAGLVGCYARCHTTLLCHSGCYVNVLHREYLQSNIKY